MLRSLLIKVPTVLLTVLALWRGAWLVAAVAFAVGTALLGWGVFNPRSSFWVSTRWRAAKPIRAVALTFDDGPDATFTPRVLAILEAKNVAATFFVVGARVLAQPQTVSQIHAAGHLLGNHSQGHDLSFHFRLWRRLRGEIDACNAAIRGVIGRTPRLFRSPQGFKNPALGDVLRDVDMIAVGWQVRGLDALGTDADAIARRVLDGVVAGGVVLLHDGAGLHGSLDRNPTLEALPVIIDGLRAQGLAIVRLDELLAVDGYR